MPFGTRGSLYPAYGLTVQRYRINFIRFVWRVTPIVNHPLSSFIGMDVTASSGTEPSAVGQKRRCTRTREAQFCGHCNAVVSHATYYRHLSKYFNRNEGVWIRETDLELNTDSGSESEEVPEVPVEDDSNQTATPDDHPLNESTSNQAGSNSDSNSPLESYTVSC